MKLVPSGTITGVSFMIDVVPVESNSPYKVESNGESDDKRNRNVNGILH